MSSSPILEQRDDQLQIDASIGSTSASRHDLEPVRDGLDPHGSAAASL
jgi:hypothetical protein